ncbi:MAG: rhomboid family intramembrane serine protease [Bacteroidaceae bacterium]|nr:rhomboid family intramembrane serine protease [Bacteroidaceae bacterium]
MHLFDIVKSKYDESMLNRLVIINCAVYIVALLSDAILNFTDSSLTGAVITQFQWNPDNIPFRPWTVLTAPFTSWGLWHLLFNMITLYWLGSLFLSMGTSNTLRGLYMLGAFSAMAALVIMNLIPGIQGKDWPQSIPLASASVLAIGTSLVFQQPDKTENIPLLGHVKIKWIVLALGLADISMLPRVTPASDIAHLAAAATGWFFQRQIWKGKDITAPITKFFIFLDTWLKKGK